MSGSGNPELIFLIKFLILFVFEAHPLDQDPDPGTLLRSLKLGHHLFNTSRYLL